MSAELNAAERVRLVIHGGAGVPTEAEMREDGHTRVDYEKALADALRAGYRALERPTATGADGVEAAIRVLEDCELFNAGRGAVFNHDGRVELDASMMEGRVTATDDERQRGKRDPRLRAGAVAGVWHVKNPIAAARALMESPDQRHVLLTGEGAEAYVLSEGVRDKFHIESVSNVYFWTDKQVRRIRREAAKPIALSRVEEPSTTPAERFGTVGAVALDRRGTIVAGTSTGGVSNKRRGRAGDSPIIGAGTYADDRACGVSCTGTGEVFIRHSVAHAVVSRMRFAKLAVADAARETLAELPDEDGGIGGLIALDAQGNHAFALSPRTDGMSRGYVTDDGRIFVALYAGDAMKPMGAARE